MQKEVVIETKTGTSLEFATKDNGTIRVTRIEGISSQVQTVQGKNLVESYSMPSLSIYNDCLQTKGSLKPNTYYTISFTGYSGSRIYQNENLFTTTAPLSINGTRQAFTFLTKTTIDKTNASQYNADGWRIFKNYQDNYANVFTDLQIEEGSTATAYEPFVPNSPSPDYPSHIISAHDFNITAGNGVESNAAAVNDTLRSLPNGVKDTYEVIGDKLYKVQRVGTAVLDGSTDEIITVSSRYIDPCTGFVATINDIKQVFNGAIISDKFKSIEGTTNVTTESIMKPADNQGVVFGLLKSRLAGWSDAMTNLQKVDLCKTWLATNPFTAQYELATPIYTEIPPISLQSYGFGITKISTSGTLHPVLTAELGSLFYDVDRYLNLITSEHSDKPKFGMFLRAAIKKLDLAFMDMDEDFDLSTAVGMQLDVIGVILGLRRTLTYQPSGGISAVLSDGDYRSLLNARVILNQWDGTMQTLTDALTSWNPSIYFAIKDNQDMSVDVMVIGANHFHAELIENGYVMPKPAGIKINYSISDDVIFAYDFDTGTASGYDNGSWL